SLVKKRIVDTKTGLTPAEQLITIYAHCQNLYAHHENIFNEIKDGLTQNGIHHLGVNDLNDEQKDFLKDYLIDSVMPLTSPQIINALHPFPHLENGALYVVVRLAERGVEDDTAAAQAATSEAAETAQDTQEAAPKTEKGAKKEVGKKKKNKKASAEGVVLGIVGLPKQCDRIIVLPGDELSFILLENALELLAPEIFSMYAVKHSNVICVTRNADLDASEGEDESDDEDYREHMKRILKKRSRLAPVRLESCRPLSDTVAKFLFKRLNLKEHQAFVTQAPLDMSYIYPLNGLIDDDVRAKFSYIPFTPQWPSSLKRNLSIIKQAEESDILLNYPYESIDPLVELLKEAAADPSVISIKITLYRMASQSHLAEELIAAAENGKDVTALFELRARFDETNNIEWSQRFEQAGARVIYGFRDYKVHSKICCITRQTKKGIQYITHLCTGNYNEKTAKLYTDFSFITTDNAFGRDATKFFHNMGLEYTSDEYKTLLVAPLQIKSMLMNGIDAEIEKAKQGHDCGLFIKTNSVTDQEIMEKLAEASQAGVPITLFVRGICCLVPGIVGYTENIRVVSIVGRLLEHSRIYGFGPLDSMKVFLASADLMTRNMERRIEIAWPVLDERLRKRVIEYVRISLTDTLKLRELCPDKSYTPLQCFGFSEEAAGQYCFDSQDYFIKEAQHPL
ncbi:MAG: polyphosphate kinase 1, partial [Coriobacteriaceae bacterium]|nr:polyphosphate kinase 1 [Coriobacteriaceae bacterium]